ncbi:MAG: PBSX family phage terminase large subunit [Fusobacteriaceae bacterium]
MKDKLAEIYHPKQIRALESKSRILVLYGAKRAGKTFILILIFAMLVAKNKGTGRKFIIGGATLATIRSNILDDLEKIIGKNISLDQHKNFKMFGCTMMVRYGMTSDSWKGVRGFTAFGCLLNEGTALHDIYLKEVISRCSGEGARILIDTNPENPMHPVKTDYIDKTGQKLGNGRLNIDSIHFTLEDNVFLDETYIQSTKLSTPTGMFYDRDIKGLWVNAEGVIYRDFDIKKHVIDSIPEDENIVEYVGGIDWGYEHYGSLVVFAYCESGKYYLVHETTRKHEQVQDFWLPLALELQNKFSGLYFYTETARPEYTYLFADNDIDMINANKSVVPGIQYVARLFKTNSLFLVKDSIERVDKELCTYVWSKDKKEEKPNKENDDSLDAVRYALYTHSIMKGGTTFDI